MAANRHATQWPTVQEIQTNAVRKTTRRIVPEVLKPDTEALRTIASRAYLLFLRLVVSIGLVSAGGRHVSLAQFEAALKTDITRTDLRSPNSVPAYS